MTISIRDEAFFQGLGRIAYAVSTFEIAFEEIALQGGKIITARDLAYARVQTGPEHSLSKHGSFIQEEILTDAEGKAKPLLLSVPPFIGKVKKAGQSRRECKDYFPEEEVIDAYRNQAEEDMLKDIRERRVLFLPQNESYVIPTNCFIEDDVALWLFKDQAKNYGDYLMEQGIREMPVVLCSRNYIKNQKGFFEQQLSLLDLRDKSSLFGGGRGFLDETDYSYMVRGVF